MGQVDVGSLYHRRRPDWRHTMPVPADPKRPWKAYIAAALAGLSTFVTAWVSDVDPFTAKEIGAAVVAALIAAGATGGFTFAVANPPKPPADVVHDEFGRYEGGAVQLLITLLVLVVAVVLVVWLVRVLIAA